MRIEQIEAQNGVMCMLSKEKLIKEYQIALDDLNEEETVEINTLNQLKKSIKSGHIYVGIDPEDGARVALVWDEWTSNIIIIDSMVGDCTVHGQHVLERIFNHGKLYQLDNPLLGVK